MRGLTFFIFLFCFVCTACAQLAPIELEPGFLNPQTKKIKGAHLVYKTPVKKNEKLLVTIGGTGSRPRDFHAVHQVALSLGYDVVAIDYSNSVSTVKCRIEKSSGCFEHFHEEILFGKPVSEICDVNESNSFLRRLEDVLKYLSSQDSYWSRFYQNSQIKWSKLVLVGHSQGSGHAAYLAKQKPVERAVLIAGPQDNFDPLPASWLMSPSATPKTQFFALIHKDDFFKADLQVASFLALIGSSKSQLQKQMILTDKNSKDPHNELIQNKFSSEWQRFLN